ncbi:MAG TPA: hypothetical protein PKW90_30015, partial [Myxococcota bacterium]|nr:hypothetical protein [Myxococcota bacterium]
MFLLALLHPALSATLTVGSSGAGYTSINAAIAASSSGDTITVAAGSYSECVDMAGKNLTIQGAGPNTTTLSAPSGCANLFTADSGESFSLSGFRLLNSGNRLLYLVNA